MESQRFTIQTLEELDKIATTLLAAASGLSVSGATVLTLSGDLGAGKTALTKIIASQLGVTGTVTSPTFVVMKQYPITVLPWQTLVHIDAYRIESLAEVEPLHLVEMCTNPDNLVCIEWPEHIASVLPVPHLAVTLTLEDDARRTITITTNYGH